MTNNPAEFDPKICLERCASGDAAAWAQLVDKYAGLVQSVARSQGLSEDQRDDVVQIVFAILFRRIDAIEDPESLPKWLMVTTRRECWRQMRASRRQADLQSASGLGSQGEGVHPETDALESQEELSLVRAGLSLIGDRCRRLLMMLFGHDGDSASYETISVRLDIPVGSIGPTRARCLKRLMERIEALRGAE